MGRTLPSAMQVFYQERQAFSRFKRALARRDHLVVEELFIAAQKHIAEAQYAAHLTPFEIFLLSMLLEEHKEVMRLREMMAELDSEEEAVDQ